MTTKQTREAAFTEAESKNLVTANCRLTAEQHEIVTTIIDYKNRTGAWLEAAALRTLLHIAESSVALIKQLPPRKEWDISRLSGDARAGGYETADYVDGWNDALGAVKKALGITE